MRRILPRVSVQVMCNAFEGRITKGTLLSARATTFHLCLSICSVSPALRPPTQLAGRLVLLLLLFLLLLQLVGSNIGLPAETMSREEGRGATLDT